MKYILLIALLLNGVLAPAQKRTLVVKPTSRTAENAYGDGVALYDKGKYDEAIPFFVEALSMRKDYPEAIYSLGLSYRYTSHNTEAIEQFKALETLKPDYWAWFYYEAGVAYTNLKQYPEAADMFEKFLARYPKDPAKSRFHHQAKFKLQYVQQQQALLQTDKSMKDPAKLSGVVNSPYDDYMPALDPTGSKLYFTSKRLGGISAEGADQKEGDEDIYFIEKVSGTWGAPTLQPEPVNSGNNEGAASFSADGQMMVYTACGREGGIGSCDLYIANLEGAQWTKPLNMGNVVNSDKWDSQPTISFDGNRIIFSSTRDGGYGSEDLYMIERNVFGDWGPAMNLGGTVNTPFSDMSPFLSQDGKTLYFASLGHPGFGGYDLFKTVYEGGKWSAPVNLGRPINTPGNDEYFTIGGSGEVGYMASNRDGDQLDLYQVEIPEAMRPQPTVVISGVVTNEKNHEKVGAYVMVEDLNTGELIAVNKSNSVTGKYLAVLPAGRDYSVSANKQGFFFFSQNFDVPLRAKYQEIKKDIALKPIEKGAKVIINNIFFETGKATLSPQSRLELEKAVDLMKTNPTMVIEVGGHTDNVGDDASNMKLSHDRAKSVLDYLIKAGVAPARVKAKGYGEMNPVATNETDDGRKTNRRTEFVILEF